MDILSILEPVPWQLIARTAFETFIIFWFTIFALRYVSYRVFSQSSPSYLLFLLLLASGMYNGIAGRKPSIWNSFATGLILIISVFIVEKIPRLRKWINGSPVILVQDGRIDEKAMKRTLLDISDLEKAARKYGVASYSAFDVVILENDGHITGILKPENRENQQNEK